MPLKYIGTCYKSNFTYVLITPVNREGRHELMSVKHYWIRLFIKSKNIIISFLYHDEANMSYVCLFTLQ